MLERSAVVRLRDGVAIELDWDDFAWVRAALPDDQRGPPLKSAADVFARDQVVYLEPGNVEALIQLGVLAERRGDRELAARYRQRAARGAA